MPFLLKALAARIRLKRKGKTMKGVVAVSYREMALLQDYSNKTGIPIDRCVSDALFDWLADVAPVNLERFGLAPLNVQLGRRGITLVKSQKGR
jgi:hypothetical protein